MDRIMQQFGWLKLGHASYFFVASWFGKKNHCFFFNWKVNNAQIHHLMQNFSGFFDSLIWELLIH